MEAIKLQEMNNDETAGTPEKISNTSELGIAIKRLERKKRIMEEDLKDEAHAMLESMKPANILKHTIEEVRESIELKHNLFKVALGLGVGYFSRKLIIGKSAGIVKKVLGTALQYGITQFVVKKENDVNGLDSPKKKNLLKRFLST
jgi:hypothetical protein